MSDPFAALGLPDDGNDSVWDSSENDSEWDDSQDTWDSNVDDWDDEPLS